MAEKLSYLRQACIATVQVSLQLFTDREWKINNAKCFFHWNFSPQKLEINTLLQFRVNFQTLKIISKKYLKKKKNIHSKSRDAWPWLCDRLVFSGITIASQWRYTTRFWSIDNWANFVVRFDSFAWRNSRKYFIRIDDDSFRHQENYFVNGCAAICMLSISIDAFRTTELSFLCNDFRCHGISYFAVQKQNICIFRDFYLASPVAAFKRVCLCSLPRSLTTIFAANSEQFINLHVILVFFWHMWWALTSFT